MGGWKDRGVLVKTSLMINFGVRHRTILGNSVLINRSGLIRTTNDVFGELVTFRLVFQLTLDHPVGNGSANRLYILDGKKARTSKTSINEAWKENTHLIWEEAETPDKKRTAGHGGNGAGTPWWQRSNISVFYAETMWFFLSQERVTLYQKGELGDIMWADGISGMTYI